MNNNIDDILTRLQGQQPAIDNPDELTDSIMNSLPEQDEIVTKEHKSRQISLYWRWAASLLVLIACGAAIYFLSAEQPQNNIAENKKSVRDGQQVRTGRTKSPLVTEKMPAKEEVPSQPVQKPSQQAKVSDNNVEERQPSTSSTEIPYADPNVHYANHPTTNKDTTYLAPSLVDEFIAKFAKYYNVKPTAMNCAEDSTETRVVSTGYVFPDKEEIDVIGRLLQLAVKYGNNAPGYGLSLSRDQFIFQLSDNRKQTKYLWLAERVRGYILLYATHAPMDAELSSACYQDFRENFTHTKQTRKM